VSDMESGESKPTPARRALVVGLRLPPDMMDRAEYIAALSGASLKSMFRRWIHHELQRDSRWSSGVVEWNEANARGAPTCAAVYRFRDGQYQVLYVGFEPQNLQQRLLEHWLQQDIPNARFVSYLPVSSSAKGKEVQQRLIARTKPVYQTSEQKPNDDEVSDDE
jgi:predicted transcriptional regulator